MAEDSTRPDPDELLNALKKEEERERHGKLKIIFGMCAGVGKTYDMLKSAHEAQAKGIDVVVGYVETHHRAETEALLQGLRVIPRATVTYRGTTLEEMDLDAILARRPQLVLVDELAHTNAPGSRHTKRYQDVQELLDAGIDVITTLNVQHLETRADTVAQITGSTIRETVPDSMFEGADEVEIIDIPADELLKRLAEGKVYTPERSQQAILHFFQKGNLTALREMALRLTAERVDHQLRDYMKTQRIAGPWKSGQRLLMGISPSPHNMSLIRWARRMAYTMDASLVAVFVEPPRPLSDAQRTQLEKNFKLARELGAEIITTSDDDVARALVRVARAQNVTQILIGKSGRALSWRKTLLDRVIAQSGHLDVYVVGGTEGDEKPKRSLWSQPTLQSGVPQYAIAAGTVSLVALMCFPLSAFFGYQTVALILLLTVVLLPLRLSAGPVLLAAALSALVWDYFFIPPTFTFVVGLSRDMLMLLTYFAVAAVTGVLTARIRAREQAVRQREERTVALYTITRDLSNAIGQEDVADAAVTNIARFFRADTVLLLGQADGDFFNNPHSSSSLKIDEKEFGVAAWAYWNEKKAGRFTDTLPSANATYYPLSGPRYPLGVIGLHFRDDRPLSVEQESLLQNFLSQVSASLEREQLNDMAKKSIALAESERLYQTLFNSISHELRTPIAAIMSASDNLRDPAFSTNAVVRNDLAGEVHTAAQRLNRLVENLLDMTRLESGRISAAREWCDVEDLLNSAARKLESGLDGHTITIDVPADMPPVKLDYTLIEQAINNLLHNAIQYTPRGTTITLRARRDGTACVLTVADNGQGFPPDALPHVFDKFYRVPGTKTGGTGLGLSIAKGFIEAHQGTIDVRNREDGGAEFTIRLPIGEEPS